jgi:hypothetical protein
MSRGRLGLGLLLSAAACIALAAQSAQELYQRALVQEHASGDLQQAIALYAQAAQTAGKDRALAAKALIRIGQSREKLGADADAEKTYEELLRAYPEQRAEVAVAQERLKTLRRAGKIVSINPVVPAITRVFDTELAVRLATFLWSGVPDALLLEAARRGDLHDVVALNAQVLRMLRDPRSAGLLDNFFAKWLALDRLKTARPDPSLFPQVDAELLQAMDTETRLFLQSQLRGDRDAVELWTAPYTYVNERLARHYGLSGIRGNEFRRVSWPDPNRAGLLGQAGPLTLLSQPSRTSPTVRGMYVLTRFLGIDAPPPPANIPPLAEQVSLQGTMRERMTAHRTNPACASCHAMFDPLGFALENFDATGRWRTMDSGSPIDASGTFADGTRFNGAAELRAGLLKYRDAYYTNVTQLLLAYALNRKGKAGRVYDYEMPAVREIVRDASAHGYRWSAIITGIATSEVFQAKDVVP